jgi:hypothetical protein
MSASTDLGATTRLPADQRPTALARRLAGVILALLILSSGILIGRRLAGALGQPLPAGTLAVLGLLLAGAAVALRSHWLLVPDNTKARRFARLASWRPTILLLSIGLAVCVRGTSTAGLFLFWSIIGVEELGVGIWALRRRHRSTAPNPSRDLLAPRRDREGAVPRLTDLPETATAPSNIAPQDAVPDNRITQQFVRSRSAAGDDVFSGWLRVEMPPGARTTSVHVAFCPPFARTPTIDVRQVEGPAGRIKTAQSLPYGARLDFKLSQPCEEAATVLLRFVASLNEER